MSIHARLSPSNNRWPNCPGSVREEGAYTDMSGEAAISGTGTHLLLERCLDLKDPEVQATYFLGQTIGEGHEDQPEGWLIDEERCKRVQVCLDYIKHRDKELDGVFVSPESISNPGRWFGRNDWFGTCDVTLVSITGDVLEAIDYKDGYVFVDVKDSTQLLGYAAGKVAPYLFGDGVNPNFDACSIKKIRRTIVQPKVEGQPVRCEETTVEELWEKATQLAAKAELTDDPNAPLIAGEWCKYCPHGKSGNCPEITKTMVTAVDTAIKGVKDQSLFEVIQRKTLALNNLTNDQLSELLDAKAVITGIFDVAEEIGMTRIKDGQTIPGYSIGNKRGSNKWDMEDDEAVVKRLKGMGFKKDEIWIPKMTSPAQALKKKELTDRQKKRMEDELIKYEPGEEKLIKTSVRETNPEKMFSEVVSSQKILTVEEMFKEVAPPQIDFDNLSFL